MIKRGKGAWWRLCCGFCAWSMAAIVMAQPYPTRPIRLIIPFGPGGGTDIIARIVSQKLSEAWGQQVVVDNRPGGGGNIAAEISARAAPDGYTVFQLNAQNAVAVSLYKQLNYDVVRDFAAVTQLANVSFILLTHPSVPAKTVRELIALAKAQPGKLNYSSSGVGSTGHLSAELFKAMAGIDVVHIPYSAAAPIHTDLLSGQVQMVFAVVATALPPIKSGKLRPLGISSPKRFALVPDIPTIAESGVPGYQSDSWYGLVVPARTPQTVVSKLSAETRRILQLPEVKERMSALGIELVDSTPEQFAQFIKSEISRWGRAVKASGVRIE